MLGEGVNVLDDTGQEDTQSDTTPGDGLSLSKTNHNFGQIDLNATATLRIEIENISDEDIGIANITSTNQAFAISSFSEIQICDVIVASNKKILNIGLTPTQEVDNSDVVELVTSTGERFDINLSGEGTCAQCVPTISRAQAVMRRCMDQLLVWSSLFPGSRNRIIYDSEPWHCQLRHSRHHSNK